MSRMQRVKDAIGSTVTKLRADVEESHKNGKIPNDYSLGFTNGLIFCDHHINLRQGVPKFYDRTTSIGSLPKPVALKTDRFPTKQGAEEIYESLRDAALLAARNLLEKKTDMVSLYPLRDALKAMDKFIDEISDGEGALTAEQEHA